MRCFIFELLFPFQKTLLISGEAILETNQPTTSLLEMSSTTFPLKHLKRSTTFPFPALKQPAQFDFSPQADAMVAHSHG